MTYRHEDVVRREQLNAMKHVAFYEDYLTYKSKGQHNNCIAVLLVRHSDNDENVVIVAPFFILANSICCVTEIHKSSLHDHYLKISEDRARRLHPKLFERLDWEDMRGELV